MRKVILFCAATLFSLLSFAQESDADIVKVGDNIPAFTLHSTANGTINSADLKGKVVLINIFATWCGPCQSELAEVQKILWPKYKNNKDFCMLVIGREHTDDQLAEYNKRKGFTFPLYPDPKREVTGKFATKMIPRSYLINKEGKVISATTGYENGAINTLMKQIDKALK
jgi:peroxiredoxin